MKTRAVFCFIITLLVILSVRAQSSREWDRIASLFENEKAIGWSGKWSGFINEVHPVEIVLGEQNSEIKGWLTYMTSKDTLFLEGRKNGDNLFLLEYNQYGDYTGSIVGSVQNDRIEAEYKNKNETLIWPVYLKPYTITAPLPKVEMYHYIRQYVNNESSTGLNLTITARNPSTLNGFVYLRNSSLFFACKGFVIDKDKYSLIFYDFTGKARGNAILIVFGNSAQVTFLNKENDSLSVTLSLRNHYDLEWNHYASYEAMVEISYPSSNSPEFRSYIMGQSEEWFNQLKQGTRNTYTDDFAEDSERRNAVLGSAWFEPTLADDQILSGYLIQVNNRMQPKYQYQAVNYLLVQKQNFDVWTELKSRKKVEELIRNEKEKLVKKEGDKYSIEFNQWLEGQSFDILVVSNGGLLALSEYNPKFGLQRILVPKEVVKKELKLFSNLRKIME